jgi:hypothetical protein
MLEPTLALVGTAQLSHVAQLYAPEAMLLCSSHQAADDAVGSTQDSGAAAAAEGDAVGASGGPTLLQMEDVSAPDVPVPEACPAAGKAAPVEDQQPASAFVSADDIEVSVCEGETSAAAPAADLQQELGPEAPAASAVGDAHAESFTSTSRSAPPDSNSAAASPTEVIAAPSSPARPASVQAAAELSAEPAALCAQESPTAAEHPEAALAAAAADLVQEPVCTATGTAEDAVVLPAAEASTVLPAADAADASTVADGELQQAITHTSSSPQSSLGGWLGW